MGLPAVDWRTDDPVLWVQCNTDPRSPNLPAVVIAWTSEIVDREVTWCLDGQEVQTSNWGSSTSGEATFFPGSDQEFIWQLMNADKLVARVFAERGFITATFQLEGLSEILRPHRDSCDWVGFDTA